MIFVIAGLIIGLYMGYSMARDTEWLLSLFSIPLFTFAGLLAGFLLGRGIGWFPSQYRVPLEKYELVSLKDNVGTEGHFFLGSGQLKSDLKYFYYKKNSDGSFQAESVNREDATIFEDTQDKPYFQTYQSEFKYKIWYVVGVPSKNQRGEFHIPKGSILQDYSLDLN